MTGNKRAGARSQRVPPPIAKWRRLDSILQVREPLKSFKLKSDLIRFASLKTSPAAGTTEKSLLSPSSKAVA